jgi:hypothetical protein
MWVYVVIAGGLFLALSLVLGLGVARILGLIGDEISDLYELDYWASWAPPRDGEVGDLRIR